MKAFAAFLVTMFCVSQTIVAADILQTLRAGIERQKQTVQTTIRDLERTQRDFFNLNTKLSNSKIESMTNVNSIVNPALRNIQDAVNAATAEGKDASGCYETARSRLRLDSQAAFNGLEQCRSDALASVASSKDNIKATIEVGNRIVTNLDSIFLSCYSSNILTMQNCIVGKMPDAISSVKTFQGTANDVKNTANSAANSAALKAVNCNYGPVNAVRQGATDAQIEATKCIKAL